MSEDEAGDEVLRLVGSMTEDQLLYFEFLTLGRDVPDESIRREMIQSGFAADRIPTNSMILQAAQVAAARGVAQ